MSFFTSAPSTHKTQAPRRLGHSAMAPTILRGSDKIAVRIWHICVPLPMKNLILPLLLLSTLTMFAQNEKEILYVGTFSIRDSKGIYVYELNRAKGSVTLIQTITDLPSPSFLAIHPSGNYLYSVNRGAVNGEPSGSASAFRIDRKTGKLTFINHVSSFGKEPCHITVDKTGEWAFISNYNEGNLVVVHIHQDGSLGAVSDSKKYYGNSVNKFRQEQPHIHSAQVSADNRFLFVSDLGTDKIYSYTIDVKNGRIQPTSSGEATASPGAGPRHLAIHPGGKFAFSAQELTSTVGVYAIDPYTGNLKLLRDTVRSLPTGAKEVNTSADIHTDRRGKFLYLSNRGEDLISIFEIKPDGNLLLKGNQKTRGKTPRNFLVDNKGRFLWVANQNSDNITIFRINPKTGMLTFTGQEIKVPSPVCIKQISLK